VGKLVRIVSVQVIPPQGTQNRKWRKFAKLSMKTEEVPFWRLLAGYASHM
jgi:hypothetical protein